MIDKLLENSNVIGALIGFTGVALGLLVSWVRDWVAYRRLRDQQATYLAVRVICILDEFVDQCITFVDDDGSIMGQAASIDSNGFEHYFPQVPLPSSPIFPDDVDWKSLDVELMYQILAFPNLIRSTNDGIDFVANEISSPPDHSELFEARCEGYSDLGLKAIELVRLLRKKYGLQREVLNEWGLDRNPKIYLEKKKREIEDRRQKSASFFNSLNKNSENARPA